MTEPGRPTIKVESASKADLLQPGKSVTVTVQSKYKPGIVSLIFQGDVPDIPTGFPPEVMKQLEPIQRTNSFAVLVVGPKFTDSTSPEEMAADFHVGISQLQQHGKLDPISTYAPAVLQKLRSFVDAGGISQTPDITAKPTAGSEIEQQVHTAMQLSLGIK
jgi:hypothetical protein